MDKQPHLGDIHMTLDEFFTWLCAPTPERGQPMVIITSNGAEPFYRLVTSIDDSAFISNNFESFVCRALRRVKTG